MPKFKGCRIGTIREGEDIATIWAKGNGPHAVFVVINIGFFCPFLTQAPDPDGTMIKAKCQMKAVGAEADFAELLFDEDAAHSLHTAVLHHGLSCSRIRLARHRPCAFC
ncbi:MAG: hypothetical protein QS748_06960 [Candidatus Endonucleobacter bathymodioli]|uniref:Uncharacterized protein n=1 Tax=Candidatus Endonucleibacter bathymodioli TaxID=539814 RepID=A0AA90SMK3_9GAMM|nr:hypothetical protein [Candidatus Endonucleobacter bathymodioli]